MRSTVVKVLKPFDAISVENPAYPGTPDVNSTLGWIELKEAKRWPRGAHTPLRLPHFTQQQRVWLTRRARVDRGRVWLLLKVGEEWLLYDPLGMYFESIGISLTQEDLTRFAYRQFVGTVSLRTYLAETFVNFARA